MSAIRALILGAGGREHALALHLLRAERVEHVYVAPGNGGTATLGSRCSNVSTPKASGDFSDIARWAKEQRVTLCIPGPEAPLVAGVERAFRDVGIAVFGPSKEAAQLEGSKAFAKDFMARHQIPTAAYRTFTANQIEECYAFIDELGGAKSVVLKADGLAGGKGVILPETDEEAKQSAKDMLVHQMFGNACDFLVVEERLDGSELSVLAFTDGYTVRALPGCQDHKRIGEGDTGLNTGGMGAYCPTPDGTAPGMEERIRREVLCPTVEGMRRDGMPLVGMLFVGLMLTSKGPKVLEFNVRFGDPETEAVLELLAHPSTLADVMVACAERRLDCVDLSIKAGYAVSVVLASGGYPGKYATGVPIEIPTLPEHVSVYHAGTTRAADGTLLTAGGRVLAVSAVGETLDEALQRVYAGVSSIRFDGMVYRRDIAHRALAGARTKQDMTYASAGVDIDAGNALVERIKPMAKSTQRVGCMGSLGGFGGMFDLRALGLRDPILVSGTDGVGTKLRVALEYGKHDTIGIDLVAMSVNDLLVQGAQPLFFLDYFACSKLRVDMAAAVVQGVADGCRQAECALIGGETAEMPGMYVGDEYDVAGFAVGAVEREALLPRMSRMQAGDVLVGLRSSGLHSNGYSLVRKIVDKAGVSLSSPCPWPDATYATLGEALLAPTRVYVRALAHVLRGEHEVLGLAHITGGGFTENVVRMLPAHLGAAIDVSRWERPPLFAWLQREGHIAAQEMARTFNNGIGMVLVVPAAASERTVRALEAAGEAPVVLGAVTAQPGVAYVHLDEWHVA